MKTILFILLFCVSNPVPQPNWNLQYVPCGEGQMILDGRMEGTSNQYFMPNYPQIDPCPCTPCTESDTTMTWNQALAFYSKISLYNYLAQHAIPAENVLIDVRKGKQWKVVQEKIEEEETKYIYTYMFRNGIHEAVNADSIKSKILKGYKIKLEKLDEPKVLKATHFECDSLTMPTFGR